MTRPAKLGLLRRGCLAAAALAMFGCAYQLVRSGAVDSGNVSQIEAGIQKIR